LLAKPSDKTIPRSVFKVAIKTRFGETGKYLKDDELDLLVYYLSGEIPGEVDMGRLDAAFKLNERDPPMKQYAAKEI